MGWDIRIFVEGQQEHLDGFTCSICQDVLKDPVSIGCVSDHLFCQECLKDGSRQLVTCPNCREEVRSAQRRPSTFVKRLVDRLRVRCGTDDRGGCGWTGPLGDEHDLRCERREVHCTNAGGRCGWKGVWTDFQAHEKECSFGLVSCPRTDCHQSFLRREGDAHGEVCEGYRCLYHDQDGCPFLGRRAALEQHSLYCLRLHLEIQQLKERLSDASKKGDSMQTSTISIRSKVIIKDPEPCPEVTHIQPPQASSPPTPRKRSSIPSGTNQARKTGRPASPSKSSNSSSPPKRNNWPFRLSNPSPLKRDRSLSSPANTVRRSHSDGQMSVSNLFNLTNRSTPSLLLPTETSSVQRQARPSIPTNSRMSAHFNLTSAAADAQSSKRKRSVAGGNMEADDGSDAPDNDGEDEVAESDDELAAFDEVQGEWEKSRIKRPKFDGGFPQEWESKV
ncbi:hypothetical protein T439DRAFT_326533 [Meredithblackwellia eburnea MCA 4105]